MSLLKEPSSMVAFISALPNNYMEGVYTSLVNVGLDSLESEFHKVGFSISGSFELQRNFISLPLCDVRSDRRWGNKTCLWLGSSQIPFEGGCQLSGEERQLPPLIGDM